jgi:plastocyanin
MNAFNNLDKLNTQMARVTASAALLASALAVGVGPAAAEGAAVVEMTGDLNFVPETITISAGETVEWRNASRVGHTVTADAQKAANADNVHLPQGAEPFDSGMIGPDGTFSYTFDVPGRYEYVCLPHEAAGMIGEVIVE